MKKVLTILMAAVLAVSCLALSVSAKEDTRPNVFAGEGNGIVLDGEREDCYGAPVDVALAGVAHNADMPLTTAKLSVAWEGNKIFYYIEVADTTPNAVSSEFWQCDGVEFVADLLDTRLLSYPADNTVARFAVLPAVDDTNPFFLFPYMFDHVESNQVESWFTPVDEWEGNGGYVLECSFESPVELSRGMVMGFDVQIYDDQTATGNRDSQTYLADTSDTFHYCPANLGARLVLGDESDIPEGYGATEDIDERVEIECGYGAPVLDGTLDDCYGAFTKIEKQGCAHGEGNPLTTADIAFSWEGDTIYAFAKVYDTTPNSVSGNFWCDDGLELLYDLYDARANTYPNDNTVARFAILPFNTPESANPTNYFLANADESQIQYNLVQNDEGYILEVAYTVPEVAAGCLKGGATVGFDAQIYDDQLGNGNRDSQTFFGNTEDIIGSCPAVFGGKLVLAEAVAEAAPVEEVVEVAEAPVEEAPVEEVVEAPVEAAPVEETVAAPVVTAPQTFDAVILSAIAAVLSLAGYAVSKKR